MPTAQEPENTSETTAPAAQVIFWYRDLPPLAAEPLEEHTVQASSARVSGALSYGDEAWKRCYADALAQATVHLEQQVARRGGRYAHVLSEAVNVRHSGATGEAWLDLALKYMLYR